MTDDDPVRDAKTADSLLWVSYTCHGCDSAAEGDSRGSCYAFAPSGWCPLYKDGMPKWECEVE